MSSGKTTKIRMVRCPKCMQILLELPDVPVYECGGCGTRLQAKFHRNISKASTSNGLHEKEAVQTNDLGTNPGESSDAASLNEKLLGVNLPNGDKKTNIVDEKSESEHCKVERLEGATLINEDQTSVSAGDEVGISNEEQVGCANLSSDNGNGRSSSSDCDVESSRVSNEAENHNIPEDCKDELVEDVNSSLKDQNNGEEQSKSLDGLNQNQSGNGSTEPVVGINCDGEQIQGTDLSSGYLSNASDQAESSECNIEQQEIPEKDYPSSDLAIIENEMLSPSEGANSEVDVSDERKKAAETDEENDSNFWISRAVKLHDESGSDATLNVFTPAIQGLESCPNEQLEQPQVIAHHGVGHGRYTDTFEAVDFMDPGSEMSGTLIDLSKSPTTNSSRAYYGSCVSSCEGTDDLLPDRLKRSSRHAHRPESSVPLDEKSRRENFTVNRSSRLQYPIRNPVPLSDVASYNPRKSIELDRGGLTNSTRHGHQVQNLRRFERNDWPYKLPFEERNTLLRYGYDKPDYHLQNEFHANSGFQSHDNPADSDLEKMKLLRMIYELQDEINKTRVLNELANGRLSSQVTWKDRLGPIYHDHQSQGEEIFEDLNYPRYAGRSKDGNNRAQHMRYSRIPYSAEATINRHQADHLSCCCPREWQYSSQLPAAGLHQSQGSCKVHSRINLRSSCPSSPQQHLDSEFSMYRRGTYSDDQWHRDHELKKHSKEKIHQAKRHLRPLAGGAPFLACYRCFEELQLPADFLLFERKYHRLRCGACSAVLKFSLLNGTHLVPYSPTIEAPPPSEVDEYSLAFPRRNLHSTSHVDPVSFSEDYGLSYSKSYSTEEDPVYQKSLHAVQSNATERNHVSSEQREDIRRNVLVNAGKNKVENPAKTCKPSDPSSSTMKSKTVSSEIEESPAAVGGSPLHRLMGYSSPSRVIRG